MSVYTDDCSSTRTWVAVAVEDYPREPLTLLTAEAERVYRVQDKTTGESFCAMKDRSGAAWEVWLVDKTMVYIAQSYLADYVILEDMDFYIVPSNSILLRR